MNKIKNLDAMYKILNFLSTEAKTKYQKGVITYAQSMLETVIVEINAGNDSFNCDNVYAFTKSLLNGASDVKAYAYGGIGAALTSNYAIAERLCNEKRFEELKKMDNWSGWDNVQYLAIMQAYNTLADLYNVVDNVYSESGY